MRCSIGSESDWFKLGAFTFASMVKRGGWRQRVERGGGPRAEPANAARQPAGESVLCDRILEMWPWGFLSAATVQYVCEGAVLDGCENARVKDLAKIGGHGRWLQNAQRDTKRNWFKDIFVPPTYKVNVSYKDSSRPLLGEQPTSCDILLPHQVFACICEHYPKLMDSATLNTNLREFWNKAKALGDPQLHAHEMLDKEGWEDKAVPIAIYGDGASFSRTNLFEIAAWSLMLSKESTWATKMMMACFVKSAESDTTWDELWEVLVWSLTWQFRGVHPPTDHRGEAWPRDSYGHKHAGKPLSSRGYFAVVHRICGDLDRFFKRLVLRFAPAGNQPCSLCDGDRTPETPFLDLRPQAAWTRTVFHPPQALPPSGHPIWRTPGVSLFTLSVDEMHTNDLGTSAHFFASCFYTFVYEGGLAGTLDERMNQIWQRIRDLYDAQRTKTRVTNLKRALWCNIATPRQHFLVMATNAAENRRMVPIIAQLCPD